MTLFLTGLGKNGRNAGLVAIRQAPQFQTDPLPYPAGTHLENTVIALSRERVRRAQLAMEMIARYCPQYVMSKTGMVEPSGFA